MTLLHNLPCCLDSKASLSIWYVSSMTTMAARSPRDLPLELILRVADYLGSSDLLNLILGIPHLVPVLHSRHLQAKDKDGHTILYHIVEQGLENLIKPLAQWIPQSSIPDYEGWTPLHQAVRNGDEQMVKALIHAGSDISAQDNSARTALHLACEAEEAGIVQLLLDHGANPSAADYNGRTPLHEAVGRDTIILQKLIRRDGVDLNPRAMPGGLTPLFYEACLGRTSAVMALIDTGADPSIRTETGETVLQRATLGNHANIVRLLLDYGVKTNVRDNHGYTAVLVAAISGADECLRLLLKAGADITVVDNYGRNALHIAAWNGRESTVQLLLRKGVDPSALDNRGSCALCWAVERRHEGAIRILKYAQKNPVSRFIATLPSFPRRGRGKKFYAKVSGCAVAHRHSA
jgi:receptor-interacting serine/threonine-protein kinase 4